MAAAKDIDIGDGCREIGNDQEDLPSGHSVRDAVAQNFRTGDVLYFERTIDFICIEMPTSFYLWVTFTLSSATTVSSQAVLRRTDQGAGMVNVRLETKIFRRGHCEATLRHGFNALGSFGEEKDAFLATISEKTELAFREEGNLRFDFVFTVERCHREQEDVEATDTTSSDDNSLRRRM